MSWTTSFLNASSSVSTALCFPCAIVSLSLSLTLADRSSSNRDSVSLCLFSVMYLSSVSSSSSPAFPFSTCLHCKLLYRSGLYSPCAIKLNKKTLAYLFFSPCPHNYPGSAIAVLPKSNMFAVFFSIAPPVIPQPPFSSPQPGGTSSLCQDAHFVKNHLSFQNVLWITYTKVCSTCFLHHITKAILISLHIKVI